MYVKNIPKYHAFSYNRYIFGLLNHIEKAIKDYKKVLIYFNKKNSFIQVFKMLI